MRAYSLLFLVACGGVESAPVAPITLERCSYSYCGTNSGVIDHYAFHELNVAGQPNAEGFSVLGMSQGSTFYDLRVTTDHVTARGTTTVLSGQALVGARIYLAHTNGLQYAMRIRAVGNTEEFVLPHAPLETYDFEWAVITSNHLPGPVPAGAQLPIPGFDKAQDVCPAYSAAEDAGALEWDEAVRMIPAASALVFEGDRIDAQERTVSPAIDKRWLNLACGRDTLVKLRLSRSTMRTTGSNWRLEQATLKMLSADYCGSGMSFTTRGEPLTWRSLSGMELITTPTTFEARWDENGARCLDTPRAIDTKNAALAAQFPDLLDAIANDCATVNKPLPPPCKNTDAGIYEPDDLVISGNYDP